jgi:hypothetical protein
MFLAATFDAAVDNLGAKKFRNVRLPELTPVAVKILDKKKASARLAFFLDSIGRGEKIRTSDPVHPMHVRYQAALRPD